MKQKNIITKTLRERPLWMSDWVRIMLKTHRPRLTFNGKTGRDYREWRQAFAAKYREMLGHFPRSVPLNPRILKQRLFPGCTAQKVVFDAEPAMSVTAWVCLPRPLQRGRRYPGIVCCHGHGNAREQLVGLDQHGRPILTSHREIARRLACHGYVTIAPDWRVFGERAEPAERLPLWTNICDAAHLTAEHFGFNLLTLDIWDAMKTVDYLISRPEVDPARIGCVGKSLGGTMSLHLAASDQRIHGACISGYFASTGNSLRNLNSCGSQILPGLLQWGDRAEVAGLICPRPLLIQVGEYDSVFSSPDALREFARLETIYQAAGAKSKLGLDLFEGVHEINFKPILEWFNRWL